MKRSALKIGGTAQQTIPGLKISAKSNKMIYPKPNPETGDTP